MNWPWKTTPKLPFECSNQSTGSKDTVIFILTSADLYSHNWFDLTIGLALKNYPKMTHWMSKSVHWFKRYSDIYIEVSWFVQSQQIWSNYWLSNWPWKTTSKWHFECHNWSTGSKDTVIFILMSADLYSHSWFDQTIGLVWKN